MNDVKDIVPLDDMHTGFILGEIKRDIWSTNTYSWDSLIGPDENIPSGQMVDDMLLETRISSFSKDEEQKAKNPRRKEGTKCRSS
jgi:hypothetical protein